MSFTGLLRQKATVQAMTQTQNAFGEKVESFATKASDEPVRVQPNKATEKDSATGEYIVAPFTIYAGINAAFTFEDSDRLVEDGVTYEVIRAKKDSSEHHWELQAKIVTN